ncbi:hypothetical protein OS493_011815 [Desmophyllum pertusum]|uniref:Uncharacterized protein n=1 Tax=Desmophyllum pertusum TaxID=174260 RepID=A0A9W9YE30_9CNID|nr:hypothetical protein OS493_011815 [Desmophyllum pertusum]
MSAVLRINTKNNMADGKGEKIDYGQGYGSEFDELEASERNKTWRDDELSGIKRKSNTTDGLPSKRMVSSEYSREEAKGQKYDFIALDAVSLTLHVVGKCGRL